jgi:hypothetical protein
VICRIVGEGVMIGADAVGFLGEFPGRISRPLILLR